MEIGKDINLASLGLTRNDSASDAASDSEDTFLTLMMAQLRHQDPFKPMEGGEFLTQLAQFEMVSGVKGMEQGLETLATSMMSNQVLESAALVGKTVFAETSDARLEAGGTVEGTVDVPPGMTTVRLNIQSGAGELVRQITVPAGGGRHEFVWDGLNSTGQPMPPGNYRLIAEMSDGDNTLAGRVLLADQVRSVTLGGRGEPPVLNLAGGGQLSLASILEIR